MSLASRLQFELHDFEKRWADGFRAACGRISNIKDSLLERDEFEFAGDLGNGQQIVSLNDQSVGTAGSNSLFYAGQSVQTAVIMEAASGS